MSKEREVEICNVEGSLKGWGGKKKRWSLHQIETWAEREREFEICNVEGSLKGGVEKTLRPSGIAWENKEFESYPPSCSTVS